MFSRLTRRSGISIAITLLFCLLFLAINGAIAQEPPPDPVPQENGGDVSIAAAVNSRINYQGMLEEDGSPVNGTRDFTFDFFTNDACSGVAVYNLVESDVPVEDGFFDVAVDVTHGVFHGEGVWLQVTVGSTVFGCEEILPVPYALSLRPGATIVGEETGTTFGDGVLNVDNASPSHAGGVTGVFVRTATGSAVRAESEAVGVYAESVWEPAVVGRTITGTAAMFDSGEGYGVRVNADGSNHWDHAGYFTANKGNGLFVTSIHNNAVRAESGDTFGLMKPGGNVGVTGIGESWGVYGSGGTRAGVSGISDEGSGVLGQTHSTDPNDAGVQGQTWFGTATAVRALKYGTTGIAVHAINDGNTGSAVAAESTNYVGLYASSDSYRGVYAQTGRADNNYGLYTPDNIYSLNYHTSGAVMHVVQNGGDTAMEPGDVAAFKGVTTLAGLDNTPIIQVAHPEQAHDGDVAGVVYGPFNAEVLTMDQHLDATGEGRQPDLGAVSRGPIAPEDYLLLVVHGLAQVKVEASSNGLQPGDLVAAGEAPGLAGKAPTVSLSGVETTIPGTVLGKVLEPLPANRTGTVHIFVTLD